MPSEKLDDKDTYYVPPLLAVPDGLVKPTDTLCDSCTSWKLTPQDFVVLPGDDDASSERYNQKADRFFGLVADVKRKASRCPLCRLVVRALGPQVPDEEDGVPTEVTLSWSTDGPQIPGNPLEKIPTIRELTPSVFKQHERSYFVIYDTLIIDAKIGILANDAPSPNKAFLPRVIGEQIDFGMVRNWIDICNTRHTKHCAGVHPELQYLQFTDLVNEIPSLRLIDVVDNCIIPAPHRCKYAALSYVWGRINPQNILRSLKSNIGHLERPGALLRSEYYDKIPHTIRDAMHVVKELGMRYIWVDSLCIIQDDDGEGGSKMQAIAKMGFVYGAAALTIIAASGSDANAGLPGVRAGSTDRSQAIEEIQPGFRLAYKPMMQYYKPESTYYTRGWTYQEEIFSRRILIFLGGQVVYSCAMMNQCREDEVLEPQLAQAQGGISGHYKDFGVDDIGEIEELVFGYTDRLLSYDEDIYHAIAASIPVLRRLINANLCHGMPDVFFDWFLLWQPQVLQARRGVGPSWSWSGWKGRSLAPEIWMSYSEKITEIRKAQKTRTWIRWYQRKAHDSDECVRVDTVKTMAEDSTSTKRMNKRFSFPCNQTLPTPRKLVGAPTYIEDTHHPVPGSGFLQFWTISVTFDLDKPRDITKDDHIQLPDGYNYAGIFDRDGWEIGIIKVTEDWLATNVPGHHEFILLCEGRIKRAKNGKNDGEPGWKYNAMLVEWHGDGQWAERVAIGVVEKDDLDNALGAGPVWKEIILG